MISIICPTRKRPQYLERLCQSLEEKCKDKNSHDYLFGFDSDDKSSLKEFEKTDISKKISRREVIFERLGYSKMHEYLNCLARETSSKWILVVGDDCIMKTNGWDEIILSITDRLLINTKNPSDLEYSSDNLMHFAISKKWIDATGRISPYQQSDTYLTHVAKAAGKWNAKWELEICHVEEGASPSQRINDCVTKEIAYSNDIPMGEVLRDAEIISNLC